VTVLLDLLVPAITFLLMTVVGLGLRRDDFSRLRQQSKVVVAGLLGPLLLLPPLAMALTWMVQAPPEVTAGVLLIASCPIGGISNTWSYLARAATALAVTLTGLSCLFAGITMPLLARLFELGTGQRLELTAPMRLLVAQLLLMLALPVLLGMWLRGRWPAFAERHRSALQRIAFAGVGVLLLIPLIDDPRAFVAGLSTTVPLAAAFVTCSMGVGWATAAVATPDIRNRFTVAAEFGTRNIAVATYIAVSVLGRVEFARFAVTYFLVEAPLMLVAVSLFQRYRVSFVQPEHSSSLNA
jgi:BASS family bile acid:Na+ symporter